VTFLPLYFGAIHYTNSLTDCFSELINQYHCIAQITNTTVSKQWKKDTLSAEKWYETNG